MMAAIHPSDHMGAWGDLQKKQQRKDSIMIESNAIEKIEELVRESHTPSFIELPGRDGKRRTHVFVDSKGQHDHKMIFQNPIDITAETLSGICEAVMDYDADVDHDCVIRVGVTNRGVCCTLDDRGDRAHRISMGFDLSPSFRSLSSGVFVDTDQPDLIWNIRTLFPARVDETFLPAIRQLRFKSGRDEGVNIQQGRETVDLSIEQSVSSDGGTTSPDGVIEEVTLHTTVFDHLESHSDEPLLQAIKCGVRVNVQDRVFTIRPLAGEMDRAIKNAREYSASAIQSVISSASAKVRFDCKW